MPVVPIELNEAEIVELIEGNEQAKTVYNWMQMRKFFIKAFKLDDANFQFQGISGNKVSFTVTQPKGTPRSVIVVSSLDFLPTWSKAITELTLKQWDDFLWSLKGELMFAPAAFGMLPNMKEPKQIQFQKEVSFDELTEGRLFDAMDAVCRSTIWTIMTFIRKFGAPMEAKQ